jgi:ankyrin repeat protein
MASELLNACKQNDLGLVQELLDRGADPNSDGEWDANILTIAAAYGNVKIVQLLINRGADLDSGDEKRGITPLIIVSMNGDIEMFRFLLKSGANPNVCDNWGKTPMIRASESGRIEFVKLLIGIGIDPLFPTVYGRTALMEASYEGHTDVVKLLWDHTIVKPLIDLDIFPEGLIREHLIISKKNN